MIKSTLKKALLIALAIIPMTFFGQRLETPSNYWYVGVEVGPTLLFADNQTWQLDKMGWDADFNLGYVFNNTAYVYGNAGLARLKGNYEDLWEIDECKVIAANLNIGVDILQLFSKNPGRIHAIVPHLGWGMLNHKTTTKYKDGKVVKTGYLDANPGGGIGGRRPVMQIPMGVNFIFNFTKHFAANVDVITYYTSTNWLDAVGSGKSNKYDDWYSAVNFGVAYKFGVKDMSCPACEECPEVTETDCTEAIKQAVEEAKAEAEKAQAEKEAAAPAEEKAEKVEKAEEVVWEEQDIHLAFKVNNAEVAKTQANAKEAKKISDDIEAGREISSVKIIGYASPEGDEEDNMQLSEDRANATAEYLKERLGKKANGIEFETEGMGSDWDGFYEALSKSKISDKRMIEKQIMNSEDPTATLNQLRANYSQIDEILEGLRRTQIFVK